MCSVNLIAILFILKLVNVECQEKYLEITNISDYYNGTTTNSDKYYEKTTISDEYYEKTTVSDEYYEKTTISDLYYEKTTISDEYYEKTTISDESHEKTTISDEYYEKTTISDEYNTTTTSTDYYEATTISDEYYNTTATLDDYYSTTTISDNYFSTITILDENYETTTIEQFMEKEEKMSQYILKIIEHYKQPNPKGLPGATFPDPYSVPDIRQSLGFTSSLIFSEIGLHGVNNFRIPYIRADIGKMEGNAALEMDMLEVHGKYSLNMFLNSHKGHFSANITGINNTAFATLGVDRDGKLKAQNISIDITLKNIAVHFDNAGLLAILLQGVFNSMSTFLYDSIKPYILKDAHENLRQAINNKLEQVVGDIKFPNTISPLDMIMIDVRKKIKHVKMDPFKFDDYFTQVGIFNVAVNNTWITGLSSFHRIGNVSLKLENHTLIADFNIGTKELNGSTQWQFSGANGLLSFAGANSFSVNYIRGRFVLIQALDTRKRMEFKDLEIDVGNIQLRSNGMGTLDYVLEFAANILPNILRYQIVQTIQNPIRWKLQQELNEINMEDEIIIKLPEIDKMQEKGYQLADLRLINLTDEPCYDEDEFFNF